MKLTKYEHACLVLEKDGQTLVIDPGSFTQLPALSNVVAIIVTEEHMDHYNLNNLKHILEANADAKIFTTTNVQAELNKESIESTAVTGQQTVECGPFTLRLSETDHAPIHQISPCKSITVQVDDFLYYPSDSYTTTDAEVEVLALPTSGPWFKVTEAIDFANAVQSQKVIATHNALNSDAGHEVQHMFINMHLNDAARKLTYLEVGQSL